MIEVSPRDGEYTLREEDILRILDEQGTSIALVIFSGVQYYTGQLFPMKSITKKAKEVVRFIHPISPIAPSADLSLR